MDHERLLDGRLKLRHLVLLTTIADHGSVLRAAEQLRVTQPVVTRGLRELETILGVEVFERLPRGVSPTVYGQAFIQYARAILAQVRQAGRHVAELRDAHAGRVIVGTHLAGANVLLPRAIVRMKQERPHVTVVVKEATPDVLTADLLTGGIDLMVGRLTPSDESGLVHQTRLYTEPIRLVTRAGHPALGLAAPRLADLLGYPWILPVGETALRGELDRTFFDEGLQLPADRVECTSILTLRSILLDTDAIAALPLLIAREDTQLAMLSTPLETVRRLVGVTRSRDSVASPGSALLLHHLREVGRSIREALDQPPENS
ncbi:LysR substrate-binding domain-containing protein [Streptomyces sp. NPDC051018]|uniref:LysR substrate-binding domain-containing protein n=1 Tax=Streptomyces sp. NPDC051018 TaxID=3365639 RepID=UPI0037B7898A